MSKIFHGSEAVEGGRLIGATDTDYFYFQCPECSGGEILQILDFKTIEDGPVDYAPELRKNSRRDFILGLELFCRQCQFHDFVKIANIGWQDGKLKDRQTWATSAR